MISTSYDKHMVMEDIINVLPKDLHIDNMKCIEDEDLSIVMCISKPWNNLILYLCIPSSPSLTLHYHIFKHKDNMEKYKITPTWIYNIVNTITIDSFYDRLSHQVVHQGDAKSKHIIDS